MEKILLEKRRIGARFGQLDEMKVYSKFTYLERFNRAITAHAASLFPRLTPSSRQVMDVLVSDHKRKTIRNNPFIA